LAELRVDQIPRAVTDLKRPVATLLEAKKLRTEGQKRGTRYFAGGAKGPGRKKAAKARPAGRKKAGKRKGAQEANGGRKKATAGAAPATSTAA